MTNEELAVAIKSGNTQYTEELWQGVKRFVWQQAYAYYQNGMQSRSDVELEDFVQVGYFAMLKAVDYYDPATGYKFLSYMKYTLLNEFNELGAGRTSRQKGNTSLCPLSLDAPTQQDEDLTLLDSVPDPHDRIAEAEHGIFIQQLRRELDVALLELKPAEAEAVRRKYIYGQTLQEIADAMGWSVEKARSTVAQGIRQLRKNAVLQQHKDYFLPYYLRFSVSHFQRTRTSTVEFLALLSEEQA